MERPNLESYLVDVSKLRRGVSIKGIEIPEFDEKKLLGQERAVTGMRQFMRMNSFGRNDFNCFVAGVNSKEEVIPFVEYVRENRDHSNTPPSLFYNEAEREFNLIEVPAGEEKAFENLVNEISRTAVLIYNTSVEETKFDVKANLIEKSEKSLADLIKEANEAGFNFKDDKTTYMFRLPGKSSHEVEKGKFKLRGYLGEKEFNFSEEERLEERLKNPEFKDKYESVQERVRVILEEGVKYLLSDDFKTRVAQETVEVYNKKIGELFEQREYSGLKSFYSDNSSSLYHFISSLSKSLFNQIIEEEKNKSIKQNPKKNIEGPVKDPEVENKDNPDKENRIKALILRAQSALSKAKKYEVHLFRDNSKLKGQPVEFVENHEYDEIFGKDPNEEIKMLSLKEMMTAQMTGNMDTLDEKYKIGSLLRADGGYIVMNAMESLRKMVFSDLLDVLKTGKTSITSKPSQLRGLFSFRKNNKKAPRVDVNARVMMYGSTHLWYALNHYVPEFRDCFKSHAQFEPEQDFAGNVGNYVSYIKHYAERTKGIGLLADSAIEAIVEESVRESGRQNKLHAGKAFFDDLVRLADSAAKERENYDPSVGVTREDVKAVIDESKVIHGYINDYLKELMVEDVLKVNVDGEVVGEINGLVVAGIVKKYGQLGRISVEKAIGNGGIYSIERSIGKVGGSFKKSVENLSSMLSGFLSDEKELPFSIDAVISFEQMYNSMDGDSATLSQFLAVVSEISGIPLKQGYAVTGSMDQHGNVQAIGGVNYKIEGHFELCKIKGEDYAKGGEYGVVIPRSNINNLMLNPEVVEAVKENNFNVYSVTTGWDACEIVMGQGKDDVKEKFIKGMKTMVKLAKENNPSGSSKTLRVENSDDEQWNWGSLNSLLYQPVKLAGIADKLGVPSQISINGSSVDMDPRIRLAITYTMCAEMAESGEYGILR